MQTPRFHRLFELLTRVDPLVGLVWLGLAGMTVTLMVLMWTRWGQARPLRKCLVLSLLAHSLLAVYATTVRIVGSASSHAEEPVVRVEIIERKPGEQPDGRTAPVEEMPWESFAQETVVEPSPIEVARAEPVDVHSPERRPRSERSGFSGPVSLPTPPLAEPVQPEPDHLPTQPAPEPEKPASEAAQPIDAPRAGRRPGARAEVPGQPELERRAYQDTPQQPARTGHRPGLPSELLEQPLPAPRLANVEATAQPESSLSDLQDLLTRPSQGGPAQWSPLASTQADPPADGESTPIPGPRPAPDEADNLTPPSIAKGGQRGLPGAQEADSSERGTRLVGPARLLANRRARSPHAMPSIYKLRVAPDRSRIAQLRGATPDTEAAVQAALAWLAANQAADGRWDAQAHGAGRERFVAGRDRLRAGIQTDTGMTGLALLAFLAAGHTHLDGLYQPQVRRGVEYLLKTQASDGSLGGKANTFAFMYCHAIATFALSEAFAMTADERLREPVRRAVGYTVNAQDPIGGGWRYRPGDPGDTSQLGWQLMALKSAELAGIEVPESCRQRALGYLKSVSRGQHGGMASYRPGERVSRSMTAEALACRQFLGMAPNSPSAREAGDYLLGELPGEQGPNLYYWYYGTLGMCYLQGAYWEQWNRALQRTLLARQRKAGSVAGSWDPDTLWGGYGGRVYTTALATLCLEVYYRFLPLYLEASAPRPLLR